MDFALFILLQLAIFVAGDGTTLSFKYGADQAVGHTRPNAVSSFGSSPLRDLLSKKEGDEVKSETDMKTMSHEINLHFPSTKTGTHYPRNISDIFRATWNANDSDSLQQYLNFKKSAGHFIFQFINKPSQLVPSIDAVEGDMIMRDGFYSTDPNIKLTVQGIYLWEAGLLFLIANPSNAPLVKDFVLEFAPNASLTESIQRAEELASYKLMDGTLINSGNSSFNWSQIHLQPPDSCFFSILLQMQPVSSDFNARWSHLYGDIPKHPVLANLEETASPSKPHLEVKSISIKSPSCGFELTIEGGSLMFDSYYTKAVNYVVMIGIASFIEIILVIRQMEYTGTQSAASKVSMLTIGQQAMMDSYLCLIHLTVGIIVENLFNTFATASFFKFILFSMFEMRYLFVIWKSRRPQAFSEFQSMRRELGMLYVRFYGFLMLGFLAIYFIGGLFQIFILVMYSFWIPQIWCNANRDSNRALLPQYVVGLTITRSLIPLYFYGCPNNYVHAEPRPIFSVVIAAWLALQVVILFLQDKYGGRFFIPKKFLPPKYDYSRAVPARPSDEPFECVICMNSVDVSTADRDYMITPCDHVFHSACLTQWLHQKMECPTCRGVLPNV